MISKGPNVIKGPTLGHGSVSPLGFILSFPTATMSSLTTGCLGAGRVYRPQSTHEAHDHDRAFLQITEPP